MKVRNTSSVVEDLFLEGPSLKLEVENTSAEAHRVVKRLKVLLMAHCQGAARIRVTPEPDDIRAVVLALLAEADGLNPESHLQCPDEIRHYFRRTMFDELVGEPSNILYTTQISPEAVRYEAMPADFWKKCLHLLLNELNQGMEKARQNDISPKPKTGSKIK